MEKSHKKIREGVVVSDKMNKTIVVSVTRKTAHPLYKKVISFTSKFKAHDEENACKVGDRVKIIETRPLSKDKRWRILEIVGKVKRGPEDQDKGMPAPLRRKKEQTGEETQLQTEKTDK